MLEDAAVRPNEYSVRCEQCTNHHPVHNHDDMLIISVTVDGELAKGTKSHMGGQRGATFRDHLAKRGISQSQTVHIEFVDVRDGGAYADNMTWQTALIARECNCQCFVFWNVGTSFLLSGGSVGELFNVNKMTEGFVNSMAVRIRNTSKSLKHKFVVVPLAYNRETCDRDYLELQADRKAGNTPVVGKSFHKFINYNDLVMIEMKKSYQKSHEYLVDLNKALAVKTLRSTSIVYGKEYNTVKYEFCDGNTSKDMTLMNDKERLDYFVSLVRWVKGNNEDETSKEMTRKGVPTKEISLMLTPYYNN